MVITIASLRHAIMIFSPTLSLCFTMLLISDSLLNAVFVPVEKAIYFL